jgi:plastocyanin
MSGFLSDPVRFRADLNLIVQIAMGVALLVGMMLARKKLYNKQPRWLKFDRYRPWMRTCLALWWVVILFGICTYYVWYVNGASTSAAPAPIATTPPQTTAARVTVKISNFQFTPKEVTVPAGATVEWIDEVGRHTVEADDGSFKSDTLTANGKYEHTFNEPGAYSYFCTFHGDKHGVDMAGVVKVTEASK